MNHLDASCSGKVKYEDLITLCKKLSCPLTESDMNDLWRIVSNGRPEGVGRTQDFWKAVGGFIRDERDPAPQYTKSSLTFSPVTTGPNPHSPTVSEDSVFSASLPVPHFYGVDQSDPTCLHHLTGIRCINCCDIV